MDGIGEEKRGGNFFYKRGITDRRWGAQSHTQNTTYAFFRKGRQANVR